MPNRHEDICLSYSSYSGHTNFPIPHQDTPMVRSQSQPFLRKAVRIDTPAAGIEAWTLAWTLSL